MNKIIPINEKLVILPKEESNTKGGITIPKSEDKRRPEQGTIIAMSKSIKADKDNEVKVGDLVLFDKYNADIYEINDKENLLINIGDIHAIVR